MRSNTSESAYPIFEDIQTIEEITYRLLPNVYASWRHDFEINHRYAELNVTSQDSYQRQTLSPAETLQTTGWQALSHVIPTDVCNSMVAEAIKHNGSMYHPNFINHLLPIILSEAVDAQISGYFSSEYALAWFSFIQHDPQPQSEQWQCAVGPEKQLTLQIYLNYTEKDQHGTQFLSQETTAQLKKMGYMFNSPEVGTENIVPLCKANQLTVVSSLGEPQQSGDALLFNPNQIAYRHQQPKLASQHILQLCFIPSPYHWQYTKNHVLFSQTKAIDYKGQAQKLLDFAKRQPAETNNLIAFPAGEQITSFEQVKLLLQCIFPNNNFATTMLTRLIEADPKLEALTTIDQLLETLRISFQHSINWQDELGLDNAYNLSQLAAYEAGLKDSRQRYDQTTKPSNSGIYWPSPNHSTHPGNKFQTLPYVKKHPIMDITTPIGSAGSCFAQEIAKVFQETGHNYIVTERNDAPSSGMIVDNYNVGDPYAISCANYGIIFNTPSFRQLAERAFEIKTTEKMLFQQPDGSWVDPYRENVMFLTEEAYVNDYQDHLKATRQALEQAEVFIITLGLNECWQFKDGSVMARMPRPNIYPLVTHKTLTVQENIDNIQTFYDIVKRHNPNLKLIISVSPVPFMATGRADECHVISANTHSKAVLRVAADELVKNNQDMYYLPSYEMVTECIANPWAEDHRHVKKSTVEQVVRLFQKIFIR